MDTTQKQLIPLDHYTVAIGASAGGLEAIHEFFDNMPASGNFSFVIVQHLSPDYKSLLVELISKHTDMRVYEAGHNMAVQKNCVYVIPNNKLLTIVQGKLQLRDKNLDKAPNTAIDTFIKSLAKDQGLKSIAIILSGTGTDGTRGAEAIQQAGGLVLVQDPISAKFDGMPNSVIAAGYADYILMPELMPEEIFAYANEYPVRKAFEGKPDEASLPEVLELINNHCGHDFHNYKTPTILRRITRRMGHLNKKKFSDYLELLRNNDEECRILGKEFLIGVTKFFRDAAAFDVLKTAVLPRVVQAKGEGEILKVWITACSTGQEAYSMAIMIDHFLEQQGKQLEVKLFATDVDADAIEYAAHGAFPAEAVSEMDPFLVERYFTKTENGYTIISRIRKQIVFARHNILKDPPFIKNDIVTCRNMLIYMNQVLQRKVFNTLLFSMNMEGYLFLGPSEIPASIKANLEETDSKWKIYKKIKDANPYNGERLGSYTLANKDNRPGLLKDQRKQKDLTEDFQSILVQEYGFAAVYIDDANEIREAVGDFRKYLSLPDKIMHLNLLKMVPSDLSVVLNTAIRKAKKEEQKVVLTNVKVRDGKTERFLNLFVKPAAKEYTAIIFSEGQDHGTVKVPIEFSSATTIESATYINELEEELQETRTSLQMAVESLETTNEELQSSNEELLSANEELQSSNEELQSLNEELHTLNTEHQLRIRELIELNDDLNNYFRSSLIGQVFVDRDMRIRKFNPTAVTMINLIDTDIGRPIDHISTNIQDNELGRNIAQVIANNKLFEKEIQLHNKTICLMRILPYVRQDSQTDGVVITFIDITANKQLDNIIKGVFNSSISAIMSFQSVRNNQGRIVDFRCTSGNYAAEHFMYSSTGGCIGQSLRNELPVLMKNGFFEKCVDVVESGKNMHLEMPFEHNLEESWYEIVANRMMDGFVITMTDITDKKQAQENLRKNYQELVRTKEHLKELNASLEEKVKERTVELSLSEERFRLVANATSDGIWDWDLVNNRIWWSESFYNLFGYDKTDPEVNKSAFWMANIHPEDRDRVKSSMYAAINQGSNWQETYRFRKLNGDYAIILDKGSVVQNELGTPYRVLGSMVDVTQLNETTQQLKETNRDLQALTDEFRFVTDFMPQMVWATRPDGYHDFYNKGWYDYTGLNYEQSKEAGWSFVLHPDDYERTLKIWTDCLATGKPYEIEYRMRRHDGVFRWFLARAQAIKDEKDQIIKWFGTCTDIHDQRTANDILEQKVRERTIELQRINSELESSNHELLQFASVASHDLKEPLRKIHIFSNLVKERFMAEHSDAVDYMNRIINSSARMTRLINDLLTFSRLSINTLFERTDINGIINEVLSDLELLIREKEAEIRIDTFPKMDVVPGQMRQVFQNIISNSLKFSRRDVKPLITIQCRRIEKCSLHAKDSETGNYCLIRICDNGIGFDEQYAQKIFTIFQRLHSKEKYEGTGIGLSITKKIIEKHNGFINAESRENEGATFHIILPIRQESTVTVEPVSNFPDLAGLTREK